MRCKGPTMVAMEVNSQISSREPAVGSIVDGRPPVATPTNADTTLPSRHSAFNPS